jgi:hypothetical protein
VRKFQLTGPYHCITLMARHLNSVSCSKDKTCVVTVHVR